MLPASDRRPLWAGRRKPSWTSLIAAAATRRRRRQGELAVTPQPQASCLQRGGALKSLARPPPLPASPGLPGVGSRNPVPEPQLLSADLNPQHGLPKGPCQRGRFLPLEASALLESLHSKLRGPFLYHRSPPPHLIRAALLQLGKPRTR